MNALAKRYESPLRPTTWEQMERFATMAARTDMVPRDYIGKPEKILIAVQLGSELGISPMQSLQNIAVVGGRPSVWGDALPGLVRASGLCEWIEETISGDGNDRTATCVTQRKNDRKPISRSFSIVDAKRAGLEGKPGPWTQYTDRMLTMRARSWCLRDAYPDVLKGLMATEEAQDIPHEPHIGPTIEAKAEPVTTAQVIRDSLPPDAPETVTQKQKISAWLDKLDMALANAPDADAVDAILARDDVQKAQERLTNGARERLQTILDAALKRTAEPSDDDDFPGVVTREGD